MDGFFADHDVVEEVEGTDVLLVVVGDSFHLQMVVGLVLLNGVASSTMNPCDQSANGSSWRFHGSKSSSK